MISLLYFWGKAPQSPEIKVYLANPFSLVIEPGEESPPDRGINTTFLLNNTLAAAMSRKPKKRRSEAQKHHITTLHMSRSDPVAYRAASQEEMTEKIYLQKKKIRSAEADAERSKKALDITENQVCPSVGVKRQCEPRDPPGCSA